MKTQGRVAEVGECAPETFSPDELPGFEKATRELPREKDGKLVATLVRTVGKDEDRRPAVLYVHGFVDYFFQVHLANAFEDGGFRFYALDLRRYGRSLRQGNLPGFAGTADEYFVELDWAFDVIRKSHPRVAALVAHSTGGLISSLYLNARRGREPAERLILSSPFLRFNLTPLNRVLSSLAACTARFAPYYRLPQKMKRAYGKTLHLTHGGEWNYDVRKKPIDGYPLYAGWFRMIRRAHAQVTRGLEVGVPILSLHSDKSHFAADDPVPADRAADIVLNVSDIKKLSLRLGEDVTLFEVPGGLHDLTLSRKEARELAISHMVKFAQEGLLDDPCATS